MSRRPVLHCALWLTLATSFIADSAGQPSPRADHPTVHVGRVVVESSDEGIVISVDERLGERSGDGFADVVYVLQQEQPTYLAEEYPLAQVRAWPGSVEVHPILGWGQGRVFVLGDDERSHDAEQLERVVGYGLARHHGHSFLMEGEGVGFTFLSDLLEKDPSAPDSDGGCTSGGIGANQCSQGCPDGTSCGTSCMSGYFACCVCTVTGARCRCSRLP